MNYSVKLAIHDRHGGYSARWQEYCDQNKIPYRMVNCYDNDIIAQLSDCDGLMWHWYHDDYRDQNLARQLIMSVCKMGKRVFPDPDTCWHYDDKVGQKYLLEAIGAPLIPSYSFFTLEDTLNWINQTTFPKVFKLRAGAGSSNVRLVENAGQARKLARKCFSKGFPSAGSSSNINQRLWVLRRDKNLAAVVHVIKGIIRFFSPEKRFDLLPRQVGYAYFQEFIPRNQYDLRILVIGNKAVTCKRFVRVRDFRASGSGVMDWSPHPSYEQSLRIAFETTKRLNAQDLAFDFIFDDNQNPLIVEISYAFPPFVCNDAPGYWDDKLNWIEGPVNPQYFIIEDFLNSIRSQKALANYPKSL